MGRVIPLRGHAYFLEHVGSRGGGPWLWLVAAALGLLVLCEVWVQVAR